MHIKADKWNYFRWPMTDQILFNVLVLENILVALTREIGDSPYFLFKIFLDRCANCIWRFSVLIARQQWT